MRYDNDLLTRLVSQAKRDNPGARWANALDRGVEILQDWPLVTQHEDADGHIGLLMRSEDSGNVYFANGECAVFEGDETAICPAYEFGQPCKHRAAAMLDRLYWQVVQEIKDALVKQIDDDFAKQARQAAYESAKAAMNELFA